jgi:hypothetical protein
MLTLKPTDIGKLKDDFVVLDADRKTIGRIILHPQAPKGESWFWTITARAPQSTHESGLRS